MICALIASGSLMAAPDVRAQITVNQQVIYQINEPGTTPILIDNTLQSNEIDCPVICTQALADMNACVPGDPRDPRPVDPDPRHPPDPRDPDPDPRDPVPDDPDDPGPSDPNPDDPVPPAPDPGDPDLGFDLHPDPDTNDPDYEPDGPTPPSMPCIPNGSRWAYEMCQQQQQGDPSDPCGPGGSDRHGACKNGSNGGAGDDGPGGGADSGDW